MGLINKIIEGLGRERSGASVSNTGPLAQMVVITESVFADHMSPDEIVKKVAQGWTDLGICGDGGEGWLVQHRVLVRLSVLLPNTPPKPGAGYFFSQEYLKEA